MKYDWKYVFEKETAHHSVVRVACIDNRCLISEEPAYKLQKDANKVTAYHIYQSFSFEPTRKYWCTNKEKIYNGQQSGLRIREAKLSNVLRKMTIQLLTPTVHGRSAQKMVCCHQIEKTRTGQGLVSCSLLHTSNPEQTT